MNLRLVFTFPCLILLAWAGLAAADPCLDRFAQISQDLSNAFTLIENIPPGLIRGEQTPKWADFNTLEKIIASVRAGKKAVTDSGKLAELQEVIADVVKSIPDNPAFAALRDASKNAHLGNTYQPTEYGLKRQYQHLLWELNRELPPELKIPGVHIPWDPRKPKLRSEAQKLIQDVEAKFQSIYSTTGYANEAEMITKTVAQDRDLKKIYEILKNEELELTIRRPESGRWWIPKVGFQNQFVTGSSRGFLTPTGRNNAEAGYLGMSKGDYEKFDNELKPKYGSLRPQRGSKLTHFAGDTSYGSDVYILKLDQIRNRLTLSAGDSLSRLSHFTGYDWEVRTHQAEAWDQLFVPWKNRAVMGPMMLKDFKEGKIGRPEDPDPSLLKMDWGSVGSYMETQIFGPLNLEDVEAFEFAETPPSGEFLEALLKRKIKIRDGRKHPPVDWDPGSE